MFLNICLILEKNTFEILIRYFSSQQTNCFKKNFKYFNFHQFDLFYNHEYIKVFQNVKDLKMEIFQSCMKRTRYFSLEGQRIKIPV